MTPTRLPAAFFVPAAVADTSPVRASIRVEPPMLTPSLPICTFGVGEAGICCPGLTMGRTGVAGAARGVAGAAAIPGGWPLPAIPRGWLERLTTSSSWAKPVVAEKNKPVASKMIPRFIGRRREKSKQGCPTEAGQPRQRTDQLPPIWPTAFSALLLLPAATAVCLPATALMLVLPLMLVPPLMAPTVFFAVLP